MFVQIVEGGCALAFPVSTYFGKAARPFPEVLQYFQWKPHTCPIGGKRYEVFLSDVHDDPFSKARLGYALLFQILAYFPLHLSAVSHTKVRNRLDKKVTHSADKSPFAAEADKFRRDLAAVSKRAQYGYDEYVSRLSSPLNSSSIDQLSAPGANPQTKKRGAQRQRQRARKKHGVSTMLSASGPLVDYSSDEEAGTEE